MTTWMEEEEGEKGRVKEFPLSKQVGVFLGRENKFILGREEGNSKLLREEVGLFFFGRIISFGVKRIKFEGLNFMIVEKFSWGINNCFSSFFFWQKKWFVFI